MSEKACICRRELNHLNSMQLLLMEALADKDWKRANLYQEFTKEAIEKTGECSRADMSAALDSVNKIPQYVEQHEEGVRPALRCLEDAFWMSIHKCCVPEK